MNEEPKPRRYRVTGEVTIGVPTYTMVTLLVNMEVDAVSASEARKLASEAVVARDGSRFEDCLLEADPIGAS